MTTPPNLPKIVLLLETSLEHGRALLRGVARYARLHGPWSLHVEPGHFGSSRRLEIPPDCRGIIARTTSAVEAEVIAATRCPAVVLESSFEETENECERHGFHEISTDSPMIAGLAASHLISLGLQHFAYCGFAGCRWSQVRQVAFAEHLASLGFPCVAFPYPVPVGEDFDPRLLRGWLRELPPMTGLMACNDMCGRQVLNASAEAGISVPDHLAVIGVDNDELMCELANPPMSSVALETEHAGYAAAQLLDEVLSGKIPNQRMTLNVAATRVIARRSTEPVIGNGSPLVASARRFIRDNISHLSGVPDVVTHLKVARRTLERSFVQAIGHGIYEEITICRLDRARRLLTETNLPAIRVAESAGFGGIQPMMRLFRQREGRTPLEYRRHARMSKW